MPPSLPSVIIFSAMDCTSLALASVVRIFSWRRKSVTRPRKRACRCGLDLSNLRPAIRCLMIIPATVAPPESGGSRLLPLLLFRLLLVHLLALHLLLVHLLLLRLLLVRALFLAQRRDIL